MPPKRKDEESSKPESANAAAQNPAGSDEGSSKKQKFAKEEPGLTAKQFEEIAKKIPITIGENGALGQLLAEPATFSTGSYGWKANTKLRIKLPVDGVEKEILVNAGVNMTVSGSKPDGKKPSSGKRGRPRKYQPGEADE